MEEQSENSQLNQNTPPVKTNKRLYISLIVLLTIALLGFAWLVIDRETNDIGETNNAVNDNGIIENELPIDLPPEQDVPVDEGERLDRDRSFEGLTEAEAVVKAEEDDITYRVVARDGEEFPVTMDYNPERINFTVEDGVVIRAEFY